jgi:hypothetical protein
MPIQIDELTTEVITESGSEGQGSAATISDPWREQTRVREATMRIQRDRSRTSAEGFDD